LFFEKICVNTGYVCGGRFPAGEVQSARSKRKEKKEKKMDILMHKFKK
jgi:hypothetical protein